MGGNQVLREIGDYAFYGCSRLASDDVALPDSVVSIGTYAFNKTAAWDAGGLIIVDNWVVGYNGAAFSVVIPEDLGVVGISNYAFYNCDVLSSITLPSTIR